jgi:predicted dehydrogenase
MTKVGLIGLGYWGPNLARVLQQTSRCEFVACSDVDPQRVRKITSLYPHLRGFLSPGELFESEIDAVVIATPIASHYEIAREALRRGKHVLVEKPLADSSEKAEQLVTLAKEVGRTLMTGHTFIYSPPVVKVKELLESGAVGDVHYISFSRVNLGLYRKDVDVIWDLAVHDISIVLYWVDEFPVEACSFGRSCIQQEKDDVAFLWLKFASGLIVSIEVSWLSPQKLRRTCVVGSKRMIVYDDTEPSEKIKIYDRGVIVHQPRTFGEYQLTYRMGDAVVPNLENIEPLLAEVEHFIHCIERGDQPRTDGKFGVDVVRVIEMATKSKWVPGERVGKESEGFIGSGNR